MSCAYLGDESLRSQVAITPGELQGVSLAGSHSSPSQENVLNYSQTSPAERGKVAEQPIETKHSYRAVLEEPAVVRRIPKASGGNAPAGA